MNTTTLETRQLSFEDIKPKRKIRYEQILDRLLTGTKTAKEVAMELFELGITQLATRIKELKELGYRFETKWESSQNRFKEPVSFKRYYLANIVADNMQHIPKN